MRAIAIYYRDNVVENRINFDVKFELNGNVVLISDYVDGFEWKEELSKEYWGFGHEAIFTIVHKKLSEMIATELMAQLPESINTLTIK